jgi:hypothetical protein
MIAITVAQLEKKEEEAGEAGIKLNMLVLDILTLF